MNNWRESPTKIDYIKVDGDIDYILAMDENGTPDLKGMIDEQSIHKIWFTVTGILVGLEDYHDIQNSLISLKDKYWEDSLYKDKRVVFHSRDIRKSTGPFSQRNINYDDFIVDLKDFLKDMPYEILSANINKKELCKRYISPYDPYNLGLEFVIERFCMLLRNKRKNGIILIESRGEKEDTKLLIRLVHILKNGNEYFSSSELKRLKGIYFNPKRTKDSAKSYWLLEIADLISYPIHKHMKTSDKNPDFEMIKEKIYHYPNHIGRGLKEFP